MTDVAYAAAVGNVLVGVMRSDRSSLRRDSPDDRKQDQDSLPDLAPQQHAGSIISKGKLEWMARPDDGDERLKIPPPEPTLSVDARPFTATRKDAKTSNTTNQMLAGPLGQAAGQSVGELPRPFHVSQPAP